MSRSGDGSPIVWPPRADGRHEDWPDAPLGEEALYSRLRDLCEEGLSIASRLESAWGEDWNSFVPADYDTVLRTLAGIPQRNVRFLELGAGTGVIAIMAGLLGFEAHGIEISPELVDEARGLAERYGSEARFAKGSYMPTDYRFVSESGDTRLGSVGIGESAYSELGYELKDFDWVYAYPWPGEGDVIRDLMRSEGAPGSTLLIHGYTGTIERYPTP